MLLRVVILLNEVIYIIERKNSNDQQIEITKHFKHRLKYVFTYNVVMSRNVHWCQWGLVRRERKERFLQSTLSN